MHSAAMLVLLWLVPQETDNFEAQFAQGLALSAQGEHVEALQAFLRAAELEPDHALTQYNIAVLLEGEGRLDEALAAYRHAAALSPDEPSLWLAFGELLFRRGRTPEAIEALEKAMPLVDAMPILAKAYETEGRPHESRELLAKYLEVRPGDVQARLSLGETLADAREYDAAISVWQGGLDQSPSSPELLYRIAEALSRDRSRYAEAEKYLTSALQSDPDHLESRLLLGRLLTRQNRVEESLDVVSRAAAEHPDSAEAQFALAGLYQRLGRDEEARLARERFETLTRGAERNEHRSARFLVAYKEARELLEQGRLLDAEAAFEKALEIEPTDAQSMSMLAKIAFSKKDAADARRWIDSAIRADASVGEYHYLSAVFAQTAGDAVAAEASVRRALGLAPGFPDAWILLGSVLVDSDRARDAVDCFQKAEALEPGNAMIHLNLASAYEALGDDENERASMDRYRELMSAKESRR